MGIILLWNVGGWAKSKRENQERQGSSQENAGLPKKKVVASVLVLMALLFSKYFYLASLTSYYTFYLISRFHLSVRSSQIYFFVFLGAVAIGTIMGGPSAIGSGGNT